jgi:hypothetical protein
MTTVFWLVVCAIAGAFGWLIWHNVRKWEARRRAEEERFASFMAETRGAAAPREPASASAPPAVLPAAAPATVAADELRTQKLLFEAAHKAGEAGEPALALQLYARLLARYPASTLAGAANAAVEAQKKKLLKV